MLQFRNRKTFMLYLHILLEGLDFDDVSALNIAYFALHRLTS